MKHSIFILSILCSVTLLNAQTTKQSIHQFKVTDLYGEPFDFSTLKGKKIMVVNTASKCGLTPQYKQLQEIYETYKDS
ncbi:MAG: glutathione peroxidase, partial [Flavobacteriales bacterium CG18_big_fil_WC_8_21_14_2_50_32_9]